MSWRRAVNVLGMACLLGAAGCATTGYDQASKTAQKIMETRGELYLAHQQISAVLQSLDQIMKSEPAYVKQAYQDFEKQLKRLEDQAWTVRKMADGMRRSGADYFGSWAGSLGQQAPTSMRAQSAQQLRVTNEDFNKIEQGARAIRSAYDPFLGDLYDIQRYLRNDLSSRGVQAIAPYVTKAKTDGAEVQRKLIETMRVMDTVARSLQS